MKPKHLSNLLQRLASDRPSRDHLLAVFTEANNASELELLFATANRIRRERVGDEVHLRGIIEFSNNCVENCHYCGLRRDNAALGRYRMDASEIETVALNGARLGYKTIVLQSGSDPVYTAPVLADLVRRIKAKADMVVTLSVGERPREDYALMREAGADRFLLKHETADPVLYRRLHENPPLGRDSSADEVSTLDRRLDVGCDGVPAWFSSTPRHVGAVARAWPLRTAQRVNSCQTPAIPLGRDRLGGVEMNHAGIPTLERRLRCIRDLKSLGYQVGAGNMVGLPGQTPESLADDIFLMRELKVDMAGIGPFIPHPNTPLAGAPLVSIEQVLKVLALTRIVLKDVLLPATTATETLMRGGRQRALQCGANVLMPNITPAQYRPLYEIYPGKVCIGEDADDCRSCMRSMVEGIGRTIAKDYGHSFHAKRKNE